MNDNINKIQKILQNKVGYQGSSADLMKYVENPENKEKLVKVLNTKVGYKGTVDDFNSYVGIQVPKVEGIQDVTAPSISVGAPEVNVMSPLVSNVPTTPKVDWATQEEGSMVKPIAGELEREQPVDFVGMTPDPKNDPDYSVINQSGKFVYTFDKEKSDRRKEKDAFNTILDEQEKRINQMIDSVGANIRRNANNVPTNQFIPAYSGAAISTPQTEDGKAQGELFAAQTILKDAKQAWKSPKKGENWAKSFGIGGLETVADPDAWLFGILSLNEVGQSLPIFEKVEKGEPLTDTESALMDAMLTRTQAEAMRSSDTSNWYKGGKIAGESLPFMRDMALTGGLNTITTAGGKGAVSLAQKATAKYLRKKAEKQLLKEGIDITEDILSRRAADLFMRTAKGADYAGRVLAASTVTPAVRTPLMATSYSGVAKNMQPKVVGDEFGTYQIQEGDDFGTAVGKQFVEVQSEGVGEFFAPILKGVKLLGGKAIPKVISDSKFGQVGSKVVDAIMLDNPYLQKAGVSGIAGEVGEEIFGQTEQYLSGLITKEDLDNFYSGDNFKSMLIGFAPMSALGMAGNAINYGSNEVQYRRAKKELGGLTDELDNSSVGELGNKISDVLIQNNAFDEDGNLTEDGRRLNNNLVSYAQRKMAKDIANDGKQENPNSRYYDFLLNDRSKKWLESYLADNDLTAPMYFNLAYKATLHENELTDYERKTLSELDRAFNGYLKAEDAAQQASAEIDAQVNPTNNKIQNVTIGGQPYTVKGGNIAMTENEEGKAILDKENSDQVITVVNAEGIPSQIGIEQLESVVGEVDAEEAKNAAFESAHTTAYNETFYPVGSIVYRKDAQGQFSAIKETGADGFTINSVTEGGEVVPTLIENTNSENFGVISLKAGDKYTLNDGTQLDIISNEGGVISASVNGQPSEQTTADELATLFESTGIDLAQFEPVVEDVVETPETEVQAPGVQVEETQATEQPEATYPTDKKGEPIFEQMPVEQSVKVVREVLGDDTVDFVEDKIKAANKVVKSVSKKTPKSMSLLGRKAEVEAIALEKQKAAESLDYWTSVKRLMSEEAIQATREQTPINQVVENPNQVGQVIIDRYESAKKVIGNPATITAPNGKVLKGRYVLVSAYSVTPSHNPFDGYNTSEGFPVNADGSNTNQRDYKNDKANQVVTEEIANSFGGQALESVPKVSKDGVVLDGNGRTIASQLAAANGTDKAYLEALNNNAANYGFTASDLKSVSNPRIVFELETELPYTTEAFAMFNSEEKKSESATASAVAKSKQLSPSAVARIAALVDSYSSLESFFSSETATAEMVKTLVDAKVINTLEIAKLIDNGLFSATGRELITNVLLGATLNEQAIRQIGNDSSLKGIIVRAMKQILENAKLKEYSLFEDINNAISLMYEARKAKMAVSEFLLQTNMFEKGASERFSDFEQMLALAMSNSGVLFKGTIDKYNTVAAPLVGGQVDMFTGKIMDPNEVKQQIIEYYGKTKSIINPNAGVDGRNRSSETARTDSGRISLESAQAKFDAAITTEEMYKAALEITLILDEQNNTTTIVAKDNEEFISMLPAKYAEAIRKERVMGVFFKGQVIINSEKFDTGEELLLTYEHEWVHNANKNVHSSDELAELWDNSTDKKILPRIYLGSDDNIKGDELIAHIIEDIIQKQGYENYKNGNIDLSLYSQQEQLKKTIDYANKEYLRNVRGGDSRGNLHEDSNARKADENLQQADEGRQTPKFRQKDDGTSGQVERNVQENVSQGGGRVRKAVTTETLLIDGVERPTRNSNGAYIHSTEEGVRNFYAWFGGKPDSDFTEIQNELLTASLFKSEIELADSIISSLKSHSGNISYFRQSRAVVDHILNNTIESDMRMLLTNVNGIISKDPQVLNSIIEFIPVDVMNNLRSEKITPDMILNDKSMLQNLLSIEGNSTIPFGRDIANSIIRCVAFSTTKPTSTLGFRESYTNSTVLTVESNPILSTLPTTKELFTAVYPVVMDIKFDTAPRTLDTNHNKLFNFITKVSVLGIENKLTVEKVINNIKKTTSKVVDEQGRPLVVYHGSEANKKFNIFNPDRTNWFTPTKNYAKAFGDKLMFEVYAKAENPLYVGNIDGIANDNAMQRLSDYSGVSVDKLNGILQEENGVNIFNITNSNAFKDLMIEKGYDSLEANEANGLKTFGVFSPSQIKSATDNVGTFDSENNDIRFKITAPQSETDNIKEQAIADGTSMKAPNGKPTNLNEKQWLQVRTKAFKDWFGDWENDPKNASKVVDANGEPMVVYHSSPENFTIFDITKSRSYTGTPDYDLPGFYFTPREEFSSDYGDNVITAFLNLRNPIKDDLWEYKRSNDLTTWRNTYDNLVKDKYDGYIGEEGANNAEEEYIAFAPSQIKSATDNTGEFSESSDDIRFKIEANKIDSEYFSAIERGDMEAAQRIVDQQAVKKGYISNTDYRMMHQAPNREDYRASELMDNDVVPSDYWTHPQYYQYERDEFSSFYKIKAAIEKAKEGKTSKVWMYRAVPKNIKDDNFRNGDWITPSREYAQSEGLGITEGYRIITQRVDLNDLWWDANSINEFGFDDGKEYAYKNTKNNRKLTDVITRDYDENIIPPSKRFNNREYDPRFSIKSPIGFYSTVENALDKIQQEKGTKDQFKAMLLKNGAKQAEMDWMGFEELPEKLTKSDIQNWINENRIEVEEVEKGEKSQDINQIAIDKYGVKFEELSSDEKQSVLNDFKGYVNDTKFSQYVLPGGENYKELLLTMPSIGKVETLEQFAKRIGKKPEEVEAAYRVGLQTGAGKSAEGDSRFKSDHFVEPNILAHIRFDERTVNGERVLFIEEFQSDWAQAGKKKGFANSEAEKRRNEIKSELETLRNELNNLRDKDAIENGNGVRRGDNLRDWTEKYQPEKDKRFSELLSELNDIESKYEFAVPDMPFKKTDQWVNLAARRMMRYAAENGFDRLAWANGTQQADRYDLSKQVDAIHHFETDKKGVYYVTATKGNSEILSKHMDVPEIESTLGKEIASKIVNKEGESRANDKAVLTLSGIDLKVGGEGMKIFYDAIVPSAMNKLGKPFGAKVEPLVKNGIDDYNETVKIHPIGSTEFRNAEIKYFDRLNEKKELKDNQSIPVTESMKESVMEGVPLFAIKAPKFEKGASLKEMVATSNMFIAARTDKYGAKGRRMVESEIKTVGKAISEQSANLKESANLVTDMVKALLNNGSMNYMTRAELSQILTNVRNASNKKDLTKEFDKISSIVRQIQLRNAKRRFNDLMKFKVQDKNAKGVSIASTVDDETVSIITTIRKSLKELTLEDVENQINEINNLDKKTTSDEIRLVGLGIARDYMNEIKTREAQLSQLAEELSKAKEGLVGKKGEDRTSGKELVESIENMVGQVKAEMTSAYDDLSSRLNKIIAEGKEALKNIKLQDKERVATLSHFVNSDMKGIEPKNNPEKGRTFKQWLKSNLIISPLQSFDFMLRSLAPNQVAGNGYLHDHFSRGILSASQNAYEGTESAFKMIDEAVAKIFGDKFTFRYVSARDFKKMSKYELTYGTEKSSTTITATNGQLAYIYAVNKMTDGAMKLRAMGISEEQVEEMKAALPVRIVKLVDAIQDEILPKLRVKYNNAHLEIFNTSMAAIENYVPLHIDKTALAQKVDLEEESAKLSGLIKNSTNSLIKRTVNTKPIDIRNSDFSDLITDHIKDMEQWAAYASIRRDMNTLLSNRNFTNRLIEIGGFEYLVQFKRAAAIAADVYQPLSDSYDTAITGVSRTVATSKVMLNLYTAFKQVLSVVAYLTEPSPKFQGKVLVNLAKGHASFKWAKDNLPDFRKRWESSALGDEKLSRQFANIASEGDFVKFMDASQKVAQKYGMYPNKLVDSYMCAVGAKSLYETNYDKYISMGATEEMARERALVDAVNLYNTTQQSSESMFVSSVQLDRTFFSTAYTVFNNSSLAYNRQVFDAARNLKNAFNNRANLIENRTKFNVRTFNISEEAAKKAAVKEVDTQIMRDVLRLAVFGYGVQFIWRLGASFPYLLFGDDDDKKKKMVKEAATGGALITPVRGLLFGATFESFIDAAMFSDNMNMALDRLTGNIHPVVSDVDQLAKAAFSKSMTLGKAGYLLVNLFTKLGFGIDLKAFSNATYGFVELIDSDELTANDVVIDIMSMLSVPQSQLKALALDSPETFFDRYIELKELVDYGLLAPVLELNPDDLGNYIKSGRRYIRRDMKEKSEKQP